MPNGGTDNCASCHFTKAARELGDNFTGTQEEREKLFWQLSHCIIRDVFIPDPYWTYCDNYHYFRDPNPPSDDVKPKRSIFIGGLYEGYARIPWDDKNQPDVSVPAICSICGRINEKGITINHNGEQLGFCTNRHYVEWWLTQHEDKKIIAENFVTPEKFFKE